MTTVVISQPMLFPWVGMFEQVQLADVYVHYDDVQFARGFINRVQVKTSRGPTWMTVPLQRHSQSVLIKDLAASDETDWRAAHGNLLSESYHDAPHVAEMLHLVAETYGDRQVPLVAVLEKGLASLSPKLGIDGPSRVERSSDLDVVGRGSQRILAIVLAVGGDVYLTGHGGHNYLDHEEFEAAGVEVRYMDYALTPYSQLHGPFTPFVSALDLIANTGSDAPMYVRPRTVPWRDFALSARPRQIVPDGSQASWPRSPLRPR